MNVPAYEANELKPFLPDVRTTCNDATVVAPNDTAWPVRVTTPSGQWAYALVFPTSPACLHDMPATIDVEVTVDRGAIGIGFLAHDGSLLCEAYRSEADGRHIATVHLQSLARCGSLMFRNALQDERSEVTIHNITATAGIVVDGEPPILRVSEETFGRYGQWSGRVPVGFGSDWLGILTHQDFDAALRDGPYAALVVQDREEWPTLPIGSDLTLDWVPLLEAVERAAETFTAVALGAGWGRWIVGGAVAAKRRGRNYRIVGVEAEPSHFAWMERHLRDNHIDLQRARAIHAAVSAQSGVCWFRSGDSAWYGQSIFAAETMSGADTVPLWAFTEVNGTPVQRVPCTDLVDVTAGLGQIDYLHLDIQGSEADVLLAHPALLDDRVASINIGTHHELIESRLRRHFTAHGWRVDLDIPMAGSIRMQVGDGPILRTEVEDGVQVWLNPRLIDASGARGVVVPKIIAG